MDLRKVSNSDTTPPVRHRKCDMLSALEAWVATLWHDRRGASAVAFAASAMVIMGFVGLATEGGLWYLGRRTAQNAADAAAVAGALAAAYNANAETAALNSAASNGFTNTGNTTVTANLTPATSSESAKVQVFVSQQMTPYISAAFMTTPVTVGATATAQLKSIGASCVLSTTGDLTISGTSISSGCAFASNSTSSTAINVTGGLLGSTAATVGGCCGSGSVSLTGKPSSPYHPPTLNPYSAADALAFPTFDASTCDDIPAPATYNGSNNTYRGQSVILLVPYNPAAPRAYCQTLSVTAGMPVIVPSGTYFFNNASLLMNGGVISCEATCAAPLLTGSTFIFTGDTGSIGTVGVGAGKTCNTSGTFSVIARQTNTYFPALSGILFYGRGIANASICASNARGRQPLGGGIYFPNSLLTFSGNSTNPSTCVSMVAKTLTLASRTTIDTTGCAVYGTALAQMQGVRLVQ